VPLPAKGLTEACRMRSDTMMSAATTIKVS
jgi:hypothetical protein